jgi:hypothetical protein
LGKSIGSCNAKARGLAETLKKTSFSRYHTKILGLQTSELSRFGLRLQFQVSDDFGPIAGYKSSENTDIDIQVQEPGASINENRHISAGMERVRLSSTIDAEERVWIR